MRRFLMVPIAGLLLTCLLMTGPSWATTVKCIAHNPVTGAPAEDNQTDKCPPNDSLILAIIGLQLIIVILMIALIAVSLRKNK